MKLLMGNIMQENDITAMPSEEGVEIVYRGEGSNRIKMLMNHNGYEVKSGSITLAPYESRIEKL